MDPECSKAANPAPKHPNVELQDMELNRPRWNCKWKLSPLRTRRIEREERAQSPIQSHLAGVYLEVAPKIGRVARS